MHAEARRQAICSPATATRAAQATGPHSRLHGINRNDICRYVQRGPLQHQTTSSPAHLWLWPVSMSFSPSLSSRAHAAGKGICPRSIILSIDFLPTPVPLRHAWLHQQHAGAADPGYDAIKSELMVSAQLIWCTACTDLVVTKDPTPAHLPKTPGLPSSQLPSWLQGVCCRRS